MSSLDTVPDLCVYGVWGYGSMIDYGTFYSCVDFGALLSFAQDELLRDEEEWRINPADHSPEMLKEVKEFKEAREQLNALRKHYETEGYSAALGKEPDIGLTAWQAPPVVLPVGAVLLKRLSNPCINKMRAPRN